jgi:hypothetical protein
MPSSLSENWQEIDGDRHACHSWQHLQQRHNSAMAYLLLILFLVFTTLAAYVPSATHRRDDPVHPSLRHLMNDPEMGRDRRIS